MCRLCSLERLRKMEKALIRSIKASFDGRQEEGGKLIHCTFKWVQSKTHFFVFSHKETTASVPVTSCLTSCCPCSQLCPPHPPFPRPGGLNVAFVGCSKLKRPTEAKPAWHNETPPPVTTPCTGAAEAAAAAAACDSPPRLRLAPPPSSSLPCISSCSLAPGRRRASPRRRSCT